MGRVAKGRDVPGGKPGKRHVAAADGPSAAPSNAPAGVQNQRDGLTAVPKTEEGAADVKLRPPEVTRRLSTGLSGFTKLPAGPSLIRSTGLAERPGGSNRLQQIGHEHPPSRSGDGVPGAHPPEPKEGLKPGAGHWSLRTELLGERPGRLPLGQTSRTAWTNVGVPGMNVIGRATPGTAPALPNRFGQRPGSGPAYPGRRMVGTTPATGKVGVTPANPYHAFRATDRKGGVPSMPVPPPGNPGLRLPTTGAFPSKPTPPPLHRATEARPAGPDVSRTSGAFRAFNPGASSNRPNVFLGQQAPASEPGGSQGERRGPFRVQNLQQGPEDGARLVPRQSGGFLGGPGGASALEAANPQVAQFWRRQEVLAKNMRWAVTVTWLFNESVV